MPTDNHYPSRSILLPIFIYYILFSIPKICFKTKPIFIFRIHIRYLYIVCVSFVSCIQSEAAVNLLQLLVLIAQLEWLLLKLLVLFGRHIKSG